MSSFVCPLSSSGVPSHNLLWDKRCAECGLHNFQATTTILALIRYLKPKPKNGFSTYEGKHYIFSVSTDEQTLQLHAKDGRGLIFERNDGTVTANLTDDDRKMLHDVDSEISRRIAQLQREREQRDKQRRRGRSRSR